VTRALGGHPELIVVLGGGMRPDGTPAPSTITRAATAAELAAKHPQAAVICSGSHGVGRRPRKSEAASMADVLVAQGVARERIFLEDESRDTIGNAVHVAERYLASLTPRPIHLVTSPFHLPRSVETFRLVLGPAWVIDGAASGTVSDDAERASHEERFLAQTRAFFADTTPGDVAEIAAKLRRRPSQAGVERDFSDYAEIAVVLGGGLRPDGSPTPSTTLRSDAAVELATRREIPLILSGSHGDGPPPERTEAQVMADRIIAAGIDPSRIFLEDRSRDTLSNAAFVAQRYLSKIGPRPLVIVTSPFHLARALATFALVLGRSWPLEGYPSAPGPHEDEHAATEERYLASTRTRLEGLTPGDVPRIVERVRATFPANVSDDPARQ
jgi:uncharacterized SAM-binding protein YcdF (DUF218 family)